MNDATFCGMVPVNHDNLEDNKLSLVFGIPEEVSQIFGLDPTEATNITIQFSCKDYARVDSDCITKNDGPEKHDYNAKSTVHYLCKKGGAE